MPCLEIVRPVASVEGALQRMMREALAEEMGPVTTAMQ
jgi:DNA-binding FrmR family transcriptional regulator